MTNRTMRLLAGIPFLFPLGLFLCWFVWPLVRPLHLPAIPNYPGYHWRRNSFIGYVLLDEGGEEAASVVTHVSGVLAQACIFKPDGVGRRACTYWDTDEEALQWLVGEYAKGEKDAN